MVSFQQTPKPRNYFSRREQRRLLLMVMSLGLIVVMMMEAGKPERWHWFAALDGRGDDSQAERTPAAQPPIDTRVPLPQPDREISGTFRLPAAPPQQPEEDTAGRYLPGIKPKYLERVRDDKLFRPEENQPWLNLLEVLHATDEATLEKASSGRVTFAQLFKQPKEYRGELVTVRGTVRRAHRMAAPRYHRGNGELDGETGKYYKLWLFPDDSPDSPMMVYCLYLPQGFPTGMELNEQAEIHALCFKRCVYNAVDSFRRAPMLAARTLHWRKARAPATAQPSAPGLGGIFVVIGVAAALCLLVTVYVYTRTPPARGPQSQRTPTFEHLRESESPPDTK